MFVKCTVAVVLSLLALSTSASTLPPVARAPEVGAPGTIPALLLHAGKGAYGLNPRQNGDDQCDPGYHHCDGSEGCCQTGYYCGTWDGKRGCCPIGETCIANDEPCEYEDYFPCSGETFCCPNGSTCSRDDLGSPQCSTSGGGSSLTGRRGRFRQPVLSPLLLRGRQARASSINCFPQRGSEDDITSSRTQNTITAATSNRNTGTVTFGSASTAPAASAFGNGAESSTVAAVWVVAGVAVNLLYM
ncbi:hypothetical protein BDQ17DRAFT_1354006 [Cyathus striatus]|nr:hypothetical protein BDQ17DRAFT_1354006 [Cyathus striatus]